MKRGEGRRLRARPRIFVFVPAPPIIRLLLRAMEISPAVINQALGSATKGDRPALEALRKKHDLSRCVDRYGATVVHYAARGGRTALLAWLVQTVGLSGSKQANNGATPAHDAAATGQLESLQWLIQYGGCESTSRDSSLATPLHLG